MRATKKLPQSDLSVKLAVTTEELQELLSLGRQSAVQIGLEAGAKITVGKRVIWNKEKVKEYLYQISE
jgi:hypothetical protein